MPGPGNVGTAVEVGNVVEDGVEVAETVDDDDKFEELENKLEAVFDGDTDNDAETEVEAVEVGDALFVVERVGDRVGVVEEDTDCVDDEDELLELVGTKETESRGDVESDAVTEGEAVEVGDAVFEVEREIDKLVVAVFENVVVGLGEALEEAENSAVLVSSRDTEVDTEGEGEAVDVAESHLEGAGVGEAVAVEDAQFVCARVGDTLEVVEDVIVTVTFGVAEAVVEADPDALTRADQVGAVLGVMDRTVRTRPLPASAT